MGKEKPPTIDLKWRRGSWSIYHYEPATKKVTWRSTGTTDEAIARTIFQNWKSQLNRPEGTSVSELLDYRFFIVSPSLEAPQAMQYSMDRLKEHIGHLDGATLTTLNVTEYQKQREPYTASVRRELSTLSAALELAEFDGLIAKAKKIKKPAAPPPREHYVTKEEVNTLLSVENLSPHLRLFIILAAATGRRTTAILDLTWDRVHFNRMILDFEVPGRKVKNKKRGVCAMGHKTAAALRSAKEVSNCDHVISFRGKRIAAVKKAFGRQVKHAGLPEWFTPHVLRHSVASWMAMARKTRDEIADFMDLDEKTVWRIYRKFNPDYLRDNAESLVEGLDF
jgi:integrase